ncbi:MAG TPA: hypothetical protein VFX74_09910 [Candidatus Limnocylindria bacterium]|nr:hypothetical protein [Candidatus Limnocylindria bacterium]
MSDEHRPEEHRPPELAEDSPTELVETDEGELVERLSGATATVLLIWLIGIGAGSALLATWIFAATVLKQHLGTDALFSGFGFYVALLGAAGPTVLWLAGRAQGHSFGWFVLTAVKIGLTMVAIVLVFVALSALVMGNVVPGPGALLLALMIAGVVVLLALIWALATWSADRYIARARIEGDGR